MEAQDDPCPGTGKCHGCRSWCPVCDNVEMVCDDAACDLHADRRAERAAEEHERWCAAQWAAEGMPTNAELAGALRWVLENLRQVAGGSAREAIQRCAAVLHRVPKGSAVDPAASTGEDHADARAMRQLREALTTIKNNCDTLNGPLEYERCVLETVYEIAGLPLPSNLCAASDAHPTAVEVQTRIISRQRAELGAARAVIAEIETWPGYMLPRFVEQEIKAHKVVRGEHLIAEARRRIAERAKGGA